MMKPLSRRTVLQGVGVSIALPFLEAMLPSRANAAPAATPKFVMIYRGNGETKNSWDTGTITDSAGNVFKDHVSVIQPITNAIPGLYRGLSNISFGSAQRYRMGDHSSRAICMLTGSRGLPPDVQDWVQTIQASRTLDFLIADRYGTKPLVIGPVDWKQQSQRPNTAYYSNLSWEGPKPATRLKSPAEVFSKITGSSSSTTTTTTSGVLTTSQMVNNSVLDYAIASINTLNQKLGASDKAKLDEYLTSLRTQEVAIQTTQASVTTSSCKSVSGSYGPMPSASASNFPALWHATTNQYLELTRLAFACGLTNVMTFMIDPESSGVIDDHHSWSHATDLAGKTHFDDLNRAYAAQVATFLKNMNATKDVDGRSLLYNSTVVYGSGLGESHNHEYGGIKLVVAGNGAGKLSPTGANDSTKMNMDSLMLTIGNNFGLGLSSWGYENSSSGGLGSPVTTSVKI